MGDLQGRSCTNNLCPEAEKKYTAQYGCGGIDDHFQDTIQQTVSPFSFVFVILLVVRQRFGTSLAETAFDVLIICQAGLMAFPEKGHADSEGSILLMRE